MHPDQNDLIVAMAADLRAIKSVLERHEACGLPHAVNLSGTAARIEEPEMSDQVAEAPKCKTGGEFGLALAKLLGIEGQHLVRLELGIEGGGLPALKATYMLPADKYQPMLALFKRQSFELLIGPGETLRDPVSAAALESAVCAKGSIHLG